MLNDLLHKLAANKANNAISCAGNGLQMAKNQFLLKPKSFVSPKSGKVSLLGKRMSFNRDQKENQGAVQQIYQPIPKRTKLDSPGVQPVQSEQSEKSSGNRKKEAGSDALRNIVKQLTDLAHKDHKPSQPNTQQTFLQILKTNQLQNQNGEKSKQLKLQNQARSSPQASNLYQLLLHEKQSTSNGQTHCGLKQKLMQLVENNKINLNGNSSVNKAPASNGQSIGQLNIFQLAANR